MEAVRVTYNDRGKVVERKTLRYAYLAFGESPPVFVVIDTDENGNAKSEIQMSPTDLYAEIMKGFSSEPVVFTVNANDVPAFLTGLGKLIDLNYYTVNWEGNGRIRVAPIRRD